MLSLGINLSQIHPLSMWYFITCNFVMISVFHEAVVSTSFWSFIVFLEFILGFSGLYHYVAWYFKRNWHPPRARNEFSFIRLCWLPVDPELRRVIIFKTFILFKCSYSKEINLLIFWYSSLLSVFQSLIPWISQKHDFRFREKWQQPPIVV